MSNKKLFLVCTETSGDLLGARLVETLKSTVPSLRIMGVGGARLEAQGMELIYHINDFNVMGMIEVISQLPRLRAQFARIKQAIAEEHPQTILLIDAPDFNMRLAKAIRQLGIPIVYYVSPQVWAWRSGRARLLARWVDHLMVLFRFEVPIYQDLGLPTTWVGHPLVDEVQRLTPDPQFHHKHGLREDLPLIALAPGSRRSEMRRLLPVMAQLARTRADTWQFVMACAPTVDRREAAAMLANAPVTVIEGEMRQIMCHAQAAVVASGTATLETALLKVPMIVGYRMNPLSYLMAKNLVRLPHIAMVNIALGKRVVPELIQGAFRSERILEHLNRIAGPSPERQTMIDAYERLPELLGGCGASRRAAHVVERYLVQ